MRLLSVLAAAAMMSGCRFWYKPVPVANAIGEEKAVLAGDTVHVHRGQRFEVYGPNADAVYDGYEQVNRVYRAYDRHFGAPVPRLAFVLEMDSIPALDSATSRAFRDRGFKVVQYTRPRGIRTRPRYNYTDYGGILWPIAPTAARRLLLEFTREQLAAEDGAMRPDSAVLELFPLWYRAAVIRLLGDASSRMRDLETVREKRNVLIPFRDMLLLVRTPTADTLLDPSRPDDVDEFTRTLVAESAMLGHYLVEREGAAVIRRVGRGYLARRRLAEILAEFRDAPRTVQELEVRWKVWIDTRER